MAKDRAFSSPTRARARGSLRWLFMAERFIESENTIVAVKTFRRRARVLANSRTSVCRSALLLYGRLHFLTRAGETGHDRTSLCDRSMGQPGHSRVFDDLLSARKSWLCEYRSARLYGSRSSIPWLFSQETFVGDYAEIQGEFSVGLSGGIFRNLPRKWQWQE